MMESVLSYEEKKHNFGLSTFTLLASTNTLIGLTH